MEKTMRKLFAATAFLAVALLGPWALSPHAQVAVVGRWQTLPVVMPINPVHVALLNNGKVLIVSGSGNDPTVTTFTNAVWDPQVPATFSTQTMAWDMFCNGMVVLPDGRAFINGGNLRYDPFFGQKKNAVFDPATGLFTDVQNMAHGRWYPTATVLGDGRVMTFSGLSDVADANGNALTNSTVEIYTPGSGWSPEYAAGWTPPLYPRMHLLPDGNVFESGANTNSKMFNVSTHAWSNVATTGYSSSRTYGTSVLLPLTPADGYRARVMIMGGGSPATDSTEIIEPLSASPAWAPGPTMSAGRIEMNATILPDGTVLALGGSVNNEDTGTASLSADLYDPAANAFAAAGANSYPRLYHSNSLLMPDATVLVVGGNPQRGSYEAHIEKYSPPYLFNPDGTQATRPTISGVSPVTIGFGATFQVSTTDAANIGSVALIRPGAPTHAFDMEQRMVKLSFTAGSGVLNVVAPPNGNIAPPGYYMLFVLNTAGVPSVATFVKLVAGAPNQAPTAVITSPASAATVTAGQTVTFAGSGTDPDGTIASYAWTFPGGSPSSSTLASPGQVRYMTPGTYVASLTVTDDKGLASSPATRTITVPDFSLSTTPTSQSLSAGSSTTYTTTVSPGTGFIDTVTFSVSGVPSGATATFAPTSVSGSGTTTLTISTTPATPGGTYPLTITATAGPIVHTNTVTLVVSGPFSVSASPSSRTVARNGNTTYTVTVTAGAGFAGTVNLSVAGLPRSASARFSPASVSTSGNSTLTVDTKKQVSAGTYTLTITGTSGSQNHSTTVNLTIQ
jgi:Domain of unknown function (DUF1929)/PKD domain/Glyoxal oxidase N-terminus